MPTHSGDSSGSPARKPYNASKARRGARHVAGTRHAAGRRAAGSSHYLSTREARTLCDHLDSVLPAPKTRKRFQALCFKTFREQAK